MFLMPYLYMAKMNKSSGHILIEIIFTVALVGLFLGTMIVQVSDRHQKLQKQQLNLAAHKFIMEARRVQQHNMYCAAGKRLRIVTAAGKTYFTVGTGAVASTKYDFRDEGCGEIVFGTSAEILFSPSGSVNKAGYIILQHKENPELQVKLNLQSVTGRLEIE